MPPIAGLHASEPKEWKLNYKILGRTNQQSKDAAGNITSMDCVHVEWTHKDGPVKDVVLLPKNHPPIHPSMAELEYEEKVVGERDVIADQINVPAGTSDSIVMQILEEKRLRLAQNLGVEP